MEKTKKLFDDWNDKKQDLDFLWNWFKRTIIWEIWICNIWVNIWSEISKDKNFQRPVLIFTKSLWWDLVWVIPFTTKYNKNYSKYLIKIENYKKFWLDYESYLSINNFKIISKKRLVKKINNFKREKYRQLFSDKFIKKIYLDFIKMLI